MKKIISLLLVAMLAMPLNAADTVRLKQLVFDSDLTSDGTATIKNLPTPSSSGDAATKQYVDDTAGVSQSSQQLVANSDTITPSSATTVLNILKSTAAGTAGVLFNITFAEGTTADTFQSANGTATVEAGTPTVSGGVLDLTNDNANFETSSLSWVRHDGTGSNSGRNVDNDDSMAFRMLFRPNFDGDPSSLITLFAITNGTAFGDVRNTCEMFITTAGEIVFRLTDQAAAFNIINVNGGTEYQWRSGELYEIEVNIDWETAGRLFRDGHRTVFGNDGAIGSVAWISQVSTEQKIFLGGNNVTLVNDGSPGFSNHFVEGFTIWSAEAADVRPHPTTGVEYQVKYLPDGVASAFETVDKIVGSSYVEGDEIQVVNMTGGEFLELVPSTNTPPETNELALKRRMTFKNNGDWIKLRWTTSHWQEVSRHYEDDGVNGPDVEGLALTNLATALTLDGSRKANLTGSETALSSDVTFVMDFSDNSCVADFAAGDAVDHCFNAVRGFTAVATPVLSGGLLDMNTSGEQSSLATFRMDGSNLESEALVGAIRVLWKPNFSGSPTLLIGIAEYRTTDTGNCIQNTTNTACDNFIRLFLESDGELHANIHDGAGTLVGDLVTTNMVPVSGTTVEIEVNWDLTTPAYRLFVDGTLEDSDVTGTGTRSPSGGLEKPFLSLGGLGAPNSASALGVANHKYEGFAVFNAVQHTATYTATGLPGATTDDETIATLVGSGYYPEGFRLTLEAREANRFEITDNASPTTDQFELNGTWDPSAVGETLDVVRSNSRWIETGRFPSTVESVVTLTSSGPITAPAIGPGSPPTRTISSGVVATVAEGFFLIETEGGGGTDDLDSLTIDSGIPDGAIIVFGPIDTTHTVVVKTGSAFGNTTDFTMDSSEDRFTCMVQASGTVCQEIARSDNAP